MGLLQQQGYTSIGGQDEEEKKTSRGMLQQRGYTTLQQPTRITPKVEVTTQKKTTEPTIQPSVQSTKTAAKPQEEGFNLSSFLGNLTETIKSAVVKAIPQLATKTNLPTSAGAPSQIVTPNQPLKTLESKPTQQQPLSATLTPSVTQQPNQLLKTVQSVTGNIIDNELRKKNYEPIIFDPNYKYQQSKATLNWTDKLQEIADKPEKLVPFLSSASEAKDLVGILSAANNFREGKATPEEMKLVKQFTEKQKQDKTFGYQVLDVVSNIPAFAGELIATGGIATLGKEGATKGIKYLMTKAGTELAEKDLEKIGFKVATGIAARTLQTPAAGATRIIANTLTKQVQSTLTVKDLKNKEDLTKSAIKAFGEQWIETLSEFSSGVFDPKFLPVEVRNKLLSSALYKVLQKVNPGKNAPVISKLFEEMGYDGILSEMLEERVADVGHGILQKIGLGDQEFKLPSANQLLVEAVSFAVPGVAGMALSSMLPGTTVMTPQQAKTQAEGTDLKGTPAGEAITKATQQAETEGKNVKIEIVDKGIVTPGGTNIKVSVVEDKAPIQQFTGEELKKITPEEKQTIVDERQKQSFIKDDTEQPKALRIGGQYATLTPEQSVALRNEVKLIPEGTKEQLHLNLESKAVGANETKVDLTQLAEQYPDVKKAIENAGIKIEPVDVLTQEADKTLLTSEQAKEVETKQTPYTKKVTEEIKKMEEDINLRRQDNEVKKSILDQFEGKTIQAMRTLKRSMIIAENKGGEMTDVENLPTYKANISDVMAAIGTNSEQEALRYIREDLPEPLTKATTREELKKIEVLKTHITPKEVSVPREQLPVGEGKQKVSRLEARMKGVLDSATEEQIKELGLATYQQMNKEETIAKAAEYVTANREDAIKVLKGDLEAPKGIPPEALYIALLQESKSDATLITKLASLQATALGQRLSLLTEIDKDSPVKLLNEVYKVREEVAKKKYKDLSKAKKSTIEDIKKEVKVASKYDIAAFFKSIECA